MSKRIRVTEDLAEEIYKDIETMLKNAKLDNGKFNFSKLFTCSQEKATVYFTPEAFLKMYVLIMNFDIEVGWYGVARRYGEENENKYIISDILVYPQEVSSVTVDFDETEYAKWQNENIDDDRIFELYMHGHSHVKMGTTPSQTDLKHQKDILNLMSNDSFYIFTIFNQKMEHTTVVYDMKKNIYFEKGDVKVEILTESEPIDEFLKNAKKIAVKKTYSGYSSSYNYNYGKGKDNKSVVPYNPRNPHYDGYTEPKKEKKKSKIDKSWK